MVRNIWRNSLVSPVSNAAEASVSNRLYRRMPSNLITYFDPEDISDGFVTVIIQANLYNEYTQNFDRYELTSECHGGGQNWTSSLVGILLRN